MSKSIVIVVACGFAALVGAEQTAFAQADSTGGTIGKTDKSVSGGEQRDSARSRATSSEKGCQYVIGTWKHQSGGNWTFSADGLMRLDNADGGKWTCEPGGVVRLTWTRGHALFVGTTDRIAVADRTHITTTNVYGFAFGLERVR